MKKKRTYRERFKWLVDGRTNGDRGVAYAKNFNGPRRSYWPTEYNGRPLPGLEMKAWRTPEAAVDAALRLTPEQRAEGERKNAEAREVWRKRQGLT